MTYTFLYIIAVWITASSAMGLVYAGYALINEIALHRGVINSIRYHNNRQASQKILGMAIVIGGLVFTIVCILTKAI